MTEPVEKFVRLLGPVRLEQITEPETEPATSESGELPRFRSRRTVALLAYLVAERRPVARDFLAALFWPDEAPSKGRANLRRELYNLAQMLPECWLLDRQAVAFVPSANTTVDLYLLLELQAEERQGEAVELLGGEFLEGLHLEANPEFEGWLLTEREEWRRRAETILDHVIEGHKRRARYADALRYTQQLLQLSPWHEQAHRQAMQLLAWTGQRGAALRQFDQCRRVLEEELSVEPSQETVALYQQIHSGELALPQQLPTFLTVEGPRHRDGRTPFVAREGELAQLDAFLNSALTGQGQVIFVSGGPGRGKTALLDAFARRAMGAHPNLLVATGNCNAYPIVGDPYLPFRDVMAMLTGDVEARWEAGAISSEHARRLWAALPLVIQALLDHGPHIVDVLVSGPGLLSRALLSEQIDASCVPRLKELVNRQGLSSKGTEQSYLFQQVTEVVRSVAKERPLLLILDDVQWADTASIGLLFHLGRRLASAASRVLIACAYRPEEVAFGRDSQRHPLAITLSEFKRAFGDVWISLAPAERKEGRRFVDALLDSGPNRLGEEFRSALFRRTEGHPLFTVELLRAMQDRGDLLQDVNGVWIEGPALDWDTVPARVEAVIAERIDRLDPQLQEMLAAASVEGEVFTAQVVAEAQKMSNKSALRLLSANLERKHRLVREQEEIHTRRGTLSRFRFAHVLFQEYIYKRLSPGERRLLHGDVASALEKLYEGQLDEMAVQVGHHFERAGNYSRALPHFIEAADRAARVHANDDAVANYTRAIVLANRVSIANASSKASLRRGRGLACQTLGDFDCAQADLEKALEIAHHADEQHLEWRLLIDLGKVWASRDYNRTYGYFARALKLARRMNDAAVIAGSLNWMGNWYANDENPVKAAECHLEALEIFERLGDQPGVAETLDLLGIAKLLGGDLNASVGYYDRAIALLRELNDRPRLLSSLMGRGTNVSLLVLLATAPAEVPLDAPNDIREALGIAREIHSPTEEAWAHWTLGLLYTVHGQFGQALELMRNGLQIASEIGHREWLVGNQFALGVLYGELFTPDEARGQLDQALALAKELRSQYWINHVVGALAATHFLLDDLTSAQDCLKIVISPETPMDTMGKRYCWARWAEMTLQRGDPASALQIVDRLIASAPGMSPGGVTTFLWQLKGEALAALGRADEADSLLRAAVENAQALRERFLLWRAQASLGRHCLARNKQSEATKELSRARELIEEMAATIPDQMLKANFLQGAYHTLNHG